jgi:hypothetical protein
MMDWRWRYVGIGVTLEANLLRSNYALALRLWPLSWKLDAALQWPGPWVQIGPLELCLEREED